MITLLFRSLAHSIFKYVPFTQLISYLAWLLIDRCARNCWKQGENSNAGHQQSLVLKKLKWTTLIPPSSDVVSKAYYCIVISLLKDEESQGSFESVPCWFCIPSIGSFGNNSVSDDSVTSLLTLKYPHPPPRPPPLGGDRVAPLEVAVAATTPVITRYRSLSWGKCCCD